MRLNGGWEVAVVSHFRAVFGYIWTATLIRALKCCDLLNSSCPSCPSGGTADAGLFLQACPACAQACTFDADGEPSSDGRLDELSIC